MDCALQSDIENLIRKDGLTAFTINNIQATSGGSINQAYCVTSRQGASYFVKCNHATKLDMFEAEIDGLVAIRDTHTIQVPNPVGVSRSGNIAFLVLESIDFGPNTRAGQENLGTALARMHLTPMKRYGWHQNNTIGLTTQINTWEDDWLTFWREHRLGFQVELAKAGIDHDSLDRYYRLMEELSCFFPGTTPVPSLLHGDLWSGNAGIRTDDTPVIFDPAVYCGDREADLAMTELFGGFNDGFYAAYNDVWPVDEDYPVRKNLYNLYHLLNHYNLFGGGYLAEANRHLDRLLSEII